MAYPEGHRAWLEDLEARQAEQAAELADALIRLPRLGEYLRLFEITTHFPVEVVKMARQTRLVLQAPDGTRVQTEDRRLVGIDLTDIPNADNSAPLTFVLEQQCDLEHWHQIAKHPLPNYDTEAWRDHETAH